MSAARSWLERYGAPLLVAALCTLSVWAKVHVNAPRTGVAHGDTGYYLTLAQNLASGRGFVIDYVPDFLAGEKGIPNPANTYWMPLTSVVLAGAMVLFGKTFAVAKAAMIVVSSLVPAVAYLLGREMFGGRRHGLFAAALATTAEVYLSAACQPQTHALVAVLGGLWLLFALRARAGEHRERWLIWLGATTGLLHLNRGDGILYIGLLGLLWLIPERGQARWGRRGLVKLAVAYAVVMAPLWLHNLASFGAPMPPGLGRVAYLVDYSQLYSLPESLTLESYLDAGSETILATKRKAIETNGMTLLLGAATGNERALFGMLRPHHWVVLVLVWAGWPLLLRRRFLPVWMFAAALWLFFTLVMSTTGLASLRATLLPFWLACFAAAGRAVDIAITWLAARFSTTGGTGGATAARIGGSAAAIAVLAWIGWSQIDHAATRTRLGVRFIRAVEEQHAELVTKLVEPLGLKGEILMARDVHELHVHTGLKLVVIPFEDEPTIHRVAKELGVTHLLLSGVPEKNPAVRPGEAAIPRTKERWELVRRDYVGGEPMRVYRVR